MSTEENKAISRRSFEEAWNKGNLAVIDEVVAANYVGHDPAIPNLRGPAGMRQLITMYRTAFPDIQFTIEDQAAEGDKVVTRWTARGSHQAELMGIAPTNKQATVTGIGIDRFVNGKIEESWGNWDTLGMLQQLGVVPTPGQGES
jgi:steroid delta-isomerase-like uncharacterized protein